MRFLFASGKATAGTNYLGLEIPIQAHVRHIAMRNASKAWTLLSGLLTKKEGQSYSITDTHVIFTKMQIHSQTVVWSGDYKLEDLYRVVLAKFTNADASDNLFLTVGYST